MKLTSARGRTDFFFFCACGERRGTGKQSAQNGFRKFTYLMMADIEIIYMLTLRCPKKKTATRAQCAMMNYYCNLKKKRSTLNNSRHCSEFFIWDRYNNIDYWLIIEVTTWKMYSWLLYNLYYTASFLREQYHNQKN